MKGLLEDAWLPGLQPGYVALDYRVLLSRAAALKTLPRTGWLLRGVAPALAETVAEHSFEAALTAYVLARFLGERGVRLDVARVLSMAILHDVEEAVTGDLAKPVKSELRGLEGVRRRAAEVLGLGEDEVKLVEEFESLGSIEAIVVKVAELVATLNQACRYLSQGFSGVRDLVSSVRREAEEVIKRVRDGRLRQALLEALASLATC